MKKKLTINKLAIGNLKTRKKQYAIMIIGIILSMTFSSTAVLFASCIKSSKQEIKYRERGKQEYIIYNIDNSEMDKFVDSGSVEAYSSFETLGFIFTDAEKKDTGASAVKMSEKAIEDYYISVKEGNFPENEGEIAIEETALEMLKIDAKVGDTIKVKLLVQNGNSYLEKPVEKSYKLTGIVNDRRAVMFGGTYASDYTEEMNYCPAAYLSENEKIEIGGKPRNNVLVFFPMEKIDEFYGKFYAQIEKLNDIHTYGTWFAANNGYDIDYFAGFGGIFAGIFFVASCFAIVNAFSSNLNDRKKQIGMLKTVGATKRQIINIFGREAFIISLITLPISIVLAYVIIKIASSKTVEIFVFEPEWWAFLLCAVVGIVAVMLSAMLPLIIASRVSPMQAIRNIEYAYKLKKKKIKTQKEFNPPKLIAKRRLSFNSGKQTVTCIFMAVVVLCGGFGFGLVRALINENKAYEKYYDYQIDSYKVGFYEGMPVNCLDQNGFDNSDIRDIALNPKVNRVNTVKSARAVITKDELTDYDRLMVIDTDGFNPFNLKMDPEILETAGDDTYVSHDKLLKKINEDNIFEYFCDGYNNYYTELRNRYNIKNEMLPTAVCSFNIEALEELKQYVTEGEIHIDKIISGEEIILLAPKQAHFIVDVYKNDFSNQLFYGYSVYSDLNRMTKNDTLIKSAERSYQVGDTIDFSVFYTDMFPDEIISDLELPENVRKASKSAKIGAIIEEIDDSNTYGISSFYYRWNIITSNEILSSLYPEDKYERMCIDTKGTIDESTDEILTAEFSKIANRGHGDVVSRFNILKEAKRENMLILSIVLALIVLAVAICASIINNSLTAQIRAGKRQIGTLRAVGASLKEIMSSYIQQLFKTLTLGMGIGFGLYFLTFGGFVLHAYIKYGSCEDFIPISILPSVIACVILFAICSFNLFIKIRKEMKNSIIDNIREL